MRLASRLTMRIHAARNADGERVQATVHRADGGEAYDVDVMFDRVSRDRTVLGLTLADALPKIWTMTPEPREILEHADVIILNGEAWKVSSRFAREDGLVEHELYVA